MTEHMEIWNEQTDAVQRLAVIDVAMAGDGTGEASRAQETEGLESNSYHFHCIRTCQLAFQ